MSSFGHRTGSGIDVAIAGAFLARLEEGKFYGFTATWHPLAAYIFLKCPFFNMVWSILILLDPYLNPKTTIPKLQFLFFYLY